MEWRREEEEGKEGRKGLGEKDRQGEGRDSFSSQHSLETNSHPVLEYSWLHHKAKKKKLSIKLTLKYLSLCRKEHKVIP